MVEPARVQKSADVGAQAAYAAVAELLDHGATMVLSDDSGASAELPADAVALLKKAVVAILQGQSPQIVSTGQTLSTQEAAQVLGISRPTLVRLLEEGEIGYQQPGGVHRRVELAALAEYQERIASRRKKVLAEMTRAAAEHDGYEQVSGFVPTR